MGIAFLTIILGAAVGLITFFVIRSILSPRRITVLANLVEQQKYSDAIRAARPILARNPRDPQAHYLLGEAYLGEDKPELALMEFKTVNEIGHFEGIVSEAPFREKIAELYLKFNQHEEALKEYLLLINKDPQHADYYYRAGCLFEERNRSAKAVTLYKKAVEVDPNHQQVHSSLGALLFRAKQFAEAREHLDTAVRLDPQNCGAHYYLGRICKEFRDHTSATAAFEKASKCPEYRLRALVERGSSLLALGDYDRAIAELERAVKHSEGESTPEALFARYFLATAYEKTRHIEPAIEQWEQIYRLDPGFGNVAEKLNEYQDLRNDDRMKDYLTSGADQFTRICHKLTIAMQLEARDASRIDNGCEIVAVESQSKWRNARTLPVLLWFLRGSEIVDETTVRALHEVMKKQSINRGAIVCSSTFSRVAQEFAESRPIDLYGKEKLQPLLQGIDI